VPAATFWNSSDIHRSFAAQYFTVKYFKLLKVAGLRHRPAADFLGVTGRGLFLTLSLRLPFKLLNPPCRVILRALEKNLKVWHFLL
jgi:hypothetical protein